MRNAGRTRAARDGQQLIIGPWEPLGIFVGVERRSYLRHQGVPGAPGPADRHPALLRPLAEGRGPCGFRRRAGAHIRHGQERLAYRERMAARPRPSAALLPPQQGQGQCLERGRLAVGGAAGQRAVSTSYLYNPVDPVPTRGGATAGEAGARTRRRLRPVGHRGKADVLVYTTAPLREDTEVTGPVSVTLFASSSRRTQTSRRSSSTSARRGTP